MRLSFVVVIAALAACASPPPGEGDTASFTKGMTWQITLSEPPTSRSHDVQVWDLDMEDTSPDVIALLKAGGTEVICYFSAGTFEPFRADAGDFSSEVKGNAYDEAAFADELYLDVTNPAVLDIMKARMDRARDKGCDGVDPDNVDLDQHDTGFAISAEQMRAFNLSLIAEAHARGLGVGLKNDTAVLGDIGAGYDFFVNESCVEFDECDAYADVLAANKPVFHIEYTGDIATICAVSQPLGLSTVLKTLDLDDTVTFCP